MKVGFIGLGRMGGDQARDLAQSDHERAVFDVFPTAMKQGAVLLVHSTIRPATAIAIAERAAAAGITMLDAPVSRTVMGKEGPFVFCMTGGDAGVAERVKPVLDCFSTDTLHVGPVGSALALKISNNLVTWTQILVGLEAFRIAEAAGVPTESLMQVMDKNGGMTPPMKAFIQGRAKAVDPAFCDFMESQAGIGGKDLKLAEILGGDVGVPTPIAGFNQKLVYGAITEVFKKA